MDAENASESLKAVTSAQSRTKRAISARMTSPYLILWGAILTAEFLLTNFYLRYAGWIFGIGGSLGTVMTFLFVRLQLKAGPVLPTQQSKENIRLLWFWLILAAFALGWVFLMAPTNGAQVNAFLCSIVAFAWIVMGLWSDELPLVLLGAVIAVGTFVGYFVIGREFYCLWMAAAAGGIPLGWGLLSRYLWK